MLRALPIIAVRTKEFLRAPPDQLSMPMGPLCGPFLLIEDRIEIEGAFQLYDWMRPQLFRLVKRTRPYRQKSSPRKSRVRMPSKKSKASTGSTPTATPTTSN